MRAARIFFSNTNAIIFLTHNTKARQWLKKCFITKEEEQPAIELNRIDFARKTRNDFTPIGSDVRLDVYIVAGRKYKQVYGM